MLTSPECFLDVKDDMVIRNCFFKRCNYREISREIQLPFAKYEIK